MRKLIAFFIWKVSMWIGQTGCWVRGAHLKPPERMFAHRINKRYFYCLQCGTANDRWRLSGTDAPNSEFMKKLPAYWPALALGLLVLLISAAIVGAYYWRN